MRDSHERKEVVRRYTDDDEFVDTHPDGGVHIERMDDGVVFVNAGGTRMFFCARKRGVLEWIIDELADGANEEVER
jgi:hypothetical protein